MGALRADATIVPPQYSVLRRSQKGWYTNNMNILMCLGALSLNSICMDAFQSNVYGSGVWSNVPHYEILRILFYSVGSVRNSLVFVKYISKCDILDKDVIFFKCPALKKKNILLLKIFFLMWFQEICLLHEIACLSVGSSL